MKFAPRLTSASSSSAKLPPPCTTVRPPWNPATDKVRVLVVDDETHVREVLIEALEAEGCEVVAAQSGEIALALYEQYEGKFDAVFTDIGMPEMSGWELCTEIRERSKTIPLAIVSGWARPWRTIS